MRRAEPCWIGSPRTRTIWSRVGKVVIGCRGSPGSLARCNSQQAAVSRQEAGAGAMSPSEASRCQEGRGGPAMRSDELARFVTGGCCRRHRAWTCPGRVMVSSQPESRASPPGTHRSFHVVVRMASVGLTRERAKFRTEESRSVTDAAAFGATGGGDAVAGADSE